MCQEARRRADGGVRLPDGAGERRGARDAGGARHPARAHRDQREERRQGPPELRAHRRRNRGRSWWMRREKCSATRRISPRAFRALPNRVPSSSPSTFSAKSPGLFVAEDQGAHELKGAPSRTNSFGSSAASGGRRFGARALTPLVGREEELDLLRRRWERAVRGEGQLALVVGEPGIGKSRLVEEFRLKLAETPHTFVEWSSSQLLQNTPLHPIAEWGRLRFGGARRLRWPAPRRPREHAAADRPRRCRRCALAGAAGGNPASGGARGESRARGIAAPAIGGADRMGCRRGAVAARRARVRGPALGRPDFARSDAGSRRARRDRRRSLSSRPRGRNSVRPGACAPITASSRCAPSIAPTSRRWWASSPVAMR